MTRALTGNKDDRVNPLSLMPKMHLTTGYAFQIKLEIRRVHVTYVSDALTQSILKLK